MMQKRIVAILLVLTMAMALLPIGVWAETETVLGSQENPVSLAGQVTTVANTGTTYYAARFAGTMILTVTGPAFTLSYEGNTYASAGNKVALEITSSSTYSPVVFSITGEGRYTVAFAAPQGTTDNPAQLVIGENTAAIRSGDTDGYCFGFTATQDGVLSILMPAGNWMYAIDKKNIAKTVSLGPYYSDAEEPVPVSAMEVAAGDEIVVTVSTYDPANPYAAPAGEVTFTATFPHALGTYENPMPLKLGPNTAVIEEGSVGYVYTWTADSAGTLTITMPELTKDLAIPGWYYCISNITADAYGEYYFSDTNDNMAAVEVGAGDQIELIVCTYDPADQNVAPAGELTVEAIFTYPQGSAMSPIFLSGDTVVTIPAGKTMYYTGRFGGQTMTAAGAGVTVEHNGQTYTVSDSGTSFLCYQEDMYNPSIFKFTNETDADVEVSLKLTVPVGTLQNPAELVMGKNTATIEEGNEQGYYFSWTATQTGTLYLKMPAQGWRYVVNNLSTYAYGTTHHADDEDLVNPAAIPVTQGDYLQIIVNSYDPNDVYSYPAATIVFTASMTEPEEPAELIKFLGTSTTLGGALTLDFMLDTAQLNGTTGNYIVLERTYADGSTDSVTVAQADWTLYGGTYYYVSYTDIAAKEIADEITALVYNAAGEVISEPWTDSIATYAQRMLGKDSVAGNTELRTVYVDLLNYGAAAQTYFGYNTENLANANLTEEQASWATAAVEVTDNSVFGTAYLGGSMTLVSEITLDMVFNVVYEEGMYAEVTFTDHYGDVVKQTLTPEDLQGSFTQVHVTGMAIADYQALVTCELYDAEGNLVGNAVDSMESYAARNANKLGEIVQAVMKLGASAYAYFH